MVAMEGIVNCTSRMLNCSYGGYCPQFQLDVKWYLWMYCELCQPDVKL
jgi:hypothetical protein